MTTVEGHTPQQRLLRAAARRRVDNLELYRAIYWASRDQKLSQRQINAVVTDLSTISIQWILARYSDDPSLLEETPSEVIDKRPAGLIDDEIMMDRLLN